jgi:hypothetical protein
MGASVTICQSNDAAAEFDARLFPIPKLVREEPEYFYDPFISESSEFIDDWAEYYAFVQNGFKKLPDTP